MNIGAISFAGYQKPAMREVKKEDCTSFVFDGYGLKDPFLQIDCYEKGTVMKTGNNVYGILVKRPEIENMARIMSSAKLTDAECKYVIDKYSA